MKSILVKIFGLIAIALMFAYCTPVERDADTLESILNARNKLTQSASNYLGQNADGSDVYSLRLMSEGVSVDYATTGSKPTLTGGGYEIVNSSYKGDGYIIFMDSLFTSETSGEPVFPVGIFDVKKSFTEGAFDVTKVNIYYVVLHNGSGASAAEKVHLADGTITVAKLGDIYTVTIDASNIEGTKLDLAFSGKIDVAPATVYINESLEATERHFDIDEISFESAYAASAYGAGFNADLDGDGEMDLSLAKLTLTGAGVSIVINEIAGAKYVLGAEPKRPEAGTYELTEWTYEDKSFTPGEIYNNKLTGSYAWLLSNPATPSFSEMWYFVEAQMAVSETDTAYSIEITATSANGSTITARYADNK